MPIIDVVESQIGASISISIAVHVPPVDPSTIKDIYSLQPLHEPWKSDMDLRLQGRLANECTDKLIVGRLDGQMVGKMWYTVCGGFGTYGSVFTAEDCRGQGIATQLLQTTLKHLDLEPGLQAVYPENARRGFHPFDGAAPAAWGSTWE